MGWNCGFNPLALVDNVMLFALIPKYHDFFGMDSENVVTFLEFGCNGILMIRYFLEFFWDLGVGTETDSFSALFI